MKTLLHSRIIRWGILIVIVVGVMVAAGATLSSSAKKNPNSTWLIGAVASGPLTINVTETGTIKSRQQEIIKSQVEGTATILYLVPEGTRVKKGELLVELDVSKIQDQKISQLIVVQNADAAAISARETLEVTRSQGQSDVSKADLDFQFAKEDLTKYEEGDYPNALEVAKANVTLAEANLKQAQSKADWSQKLFAEKYLSQTDLDGDMLALLNMKTRLQSANNDLNLLQKYTKPRKITELKATVEQTQMALDRVKRKAAADLVQAEASKRAKESELDRQKMILDKVQLMIDNAKMYAPTDGLVVYATTGGGGFRGDLQPLAEGQTVRERQELIYLPTANSAMAEVKVHESALDKVRLGLPVRVMVDAVSGKTFIGRIAKIAPLPDAQSFWQNPDLKVYNTEIWLDGENDELRTGMTCRAEIIVDHYPNALYVPVQAVVRVAGKPTVFVPSEGGPVARPVEVGLDNNSKIHVIKGLAAGDPIVLNPPLAEAAAVDQESASAPMPSIPALNAAGPQTRPARMSGMPGMRQGMPGEGRRNGTGSDRAGADRSGFNAGPGAPGASGGPGGPAGMTPGRAPGNMTPEQIQQMEQRRKQFESMSPEERQKMIEQFRQQRGQRNPGAGDGGANPRRGGNPPQGANSSQGGNPQQ
jgi:HlyD family secretion protein